MIERVVLVVLEKQKSKVDLLLVKVRGNAGAIA